MLVIPLMKRAYENKALETGKICSWQIAWGQGDIVPNQSSRMELEELY